MKTAVKILALLLLIAAAWYLIRYQAPKNTYSYPERDFAFEDTSAINKIFIANKGDQEILLKRGKNNVWTVNDKYQVRKKNLEILLETIKNLKVQYPVPRAAHNNVVKALATKGKKVEIYTEGKTEPVKVYYIGSIPPGNIGNYAMVDGAKNTFVVNVPGFNGYISNRYILDIEQWRSRMAFSYRPEAISSINIFYPYAPDNSFKLLKDDNNQYALINKEQDSKPAKMNAASALNYLQAFRNLGIETFANDFTRKDSLMKSKPYAIIEVTSNSGKVNQMSVYYMPLNKRSKGQVTRDGKRMLYDQDRFYAVLNKEKDIAVIQNYVFGKIFKSFSELSAY